MTMHPWLDFPLGPWKLSPFHSQTFAFAVGLTMLAVSFLVLAFKDYVIDNDD